MKPTTLTVFFYTLIGCKQWGSVCIVSLDHCKKSMICTTLKRMIRHVCVVTLDYCKTVCLVMSCVLYIDHCKKKKKSMIGYVCVLSVDYREKKCMIGYVCVVTLDHCKKKKKKVWHLLIFLCHIGLHRVTDLDFLYHAYILQLIWYVSGWWSMAFQPFGPLASHGSGKLNLISRSQGVKQAKR